MAASTAAAQVPPEPRIRAGVTVSGVDVGNLTVPEAQVRLEQALGPALATNILVTAAGRTFTLPMAPIGLKFRADKTALRALKAGQLAPPAPDGTLPPATAGAGGQVRPQARLALRAPDPRQPSGSRRATRRSRSG